MKLEQRQVTCNAKIIQLYAYDTYRCVLMCICDLCSIMNITAAT